MGELRPCPFCGNAADTSYYMRPHEQGIGYMIECQSCGAMGEPFNVEGEAPDRHEYTKQCAAKAWNARAPDWQSIATEAMRLLTQTTRDGAVSVWLKDVVAISERFRAAGGVL